MATTSTLQNCNFSKAILMLMLVFYHSGLYWNGNWFVLAPTHTSVSVTLFCDSLRFLLCAVYAFILLSGYIYYYVRYEYGGYNNFRQFLKKKTMRLLVPYILVCMFWVIPITCYFFNYSLSDIINRYVLGISPNQLWFVLMIFGVFMLSWPLSDYFNTHGINSIWIPASLLLIGSGLSMIFPNLWQFETALKYMLYFWLGFMFRKYQGTRAVHNVMTLNGGLLCLSVCILSFMPMVLISRDSFSAKLIVMAFMIIWEFSGAVMAFVLLNILARKIRWNTSGFKAISKLSYPIYLFHQQVIYILLWNMNKDMNPLVLTIVIWIIASLVSGVLSLILQSNKYTGIIVGKG